MELNRVVSYCLRVGVMAGALLSFLGLMLWAIGGYGSAEPVSGAGILMIVHSALEGSVVGLVYLGVLVLIATPVLRVAVSAAFFAEQRDAKYVGITILVLLMLIAGLVFQTIV